jgi:hypothetical protein
MSKSILILTFVLFLFFGVLHFTGAYLRSQFDIWPKERIVLIGGLVGAVAAVAALFLAQLIMKGVNR